MFENIMKLFKKSNKKQISNSSSKDAAKERLHLVLMQDRANVSADFLDLMRQEIIEVIKKYIDIDESAMDVRLTNQANEDGTQGAPALYANIPILNIKDENKKSINKENETSLKNKEEMKNIASKNGKEENIENEQQKPTEKPREKLNQNTQEKEEKNIQKEAEEKVKTSQDEKSDENANIAEENTNIAEENEKIEEAKKIVKEENKVEKSNIKKKAQD